MAHPSKDEYNDCYCPICNAIDKMGEVGCDTGFCQICKKKAQTYQMGACMDCLKRQWSKWNSRQIKKAEKLDKFIADAHKESDRVS